MYHPDEEQEYKDKKNSNETQEPDRESVIESILSEPAYDMPMDFEKSEQMSGETVSPEDVLSGVEFSENSTTMNTDTLFNSTTINSDTPENSYSMI